MSIGNKLGFTLAWMAACQGLMVQATQVDFNSDRWHLGADTEVVEKAGRSALSGTATLKDLTMLNGTVDVDFYTTGERSFGGIMFRVQSLQEYEWCWLRMHKTNGVVQDAVQYAPVFHGTACWQLFGGKGGMASAKVPKNRWVHMRIVFHNDTARMYIEDMTKPVLVMDDLQLGPKPGSIGVRGFKRGAIYFSNFSYTINEGETDPPPTEGAIKTILADWQLSPPFKVDNFEAIAAYPKEQLANTENWTVPQVESSGLVNITRYHGRQKGKPDCAILKTTIESKAARSTRLKFGYSDAAAIFLNGQPVFWGNSAYRSRNMAFGGWISYNDAVYLNLKKGHNELVVVVAEVFGGCGFQAQWAN